MGKNAAVIEDHLHHGAGALEMTTAEEVLHLVVDHREGEAFLVAGAGPSLEIGGERDHCHERETTSHLAPFPGLGVALGRMKGNNMAAFRKECKRIWRDGYILARIFFGGGGGNLDAFLKCFTC